MVGVARALGRVCSFGMRQAWSERLRWTDGVRQDWYSDACKPELVRLVTGDANADAEVRVLSLAAAIRFVVGASTGSRTRVGRKGSGDWHSRSRGGYEQNPVEAWLAWWRARSCASVAVAGELPESLRAAIEVARGNGGDRVGRGGR